MHLSSLLTSALLAISVSATPVEKRAGPAPGVVITKCNRPGVFALAFDDGPYTYTQKAVDILDKAGAKATFFFTGTLYGCIFNQKTAIQNAYKSGHQIASHTWTHPHIGQLSAADMRTQMTKVENALALIIGKKPTYMRPPYLETGGSVLSVMKELGYRVITDDVDAGDWNKKTPAQSLQTVKSAGASGNGHIILMHETYQSTVETLVPSILDWGKQNNLKFVTVADCLGDADGAYQAGTATGTGSMTC